MWTYRYRGLGLWAFLSLVVWAVAPHAIGSGILSIMGYLLVMGLVSVMVWGLGAALAEVLMGYLETHNYLSERRHLTIRRWIGFTN
jgi:hypothetical protein